MSLSACLAPPVPSPDVPAPKQQQAKLKSFCRTFTLNKQIRHRQTEPEFQVKDSVAGAFHLQPPALLLPLSESGFGGLDLLAVPLPLLLPALLLLPMLRLQLVEAGQLFPLQGQVTLLLLLQQHVPSVAAGLGGALRQRRPLQLDVTVLLRYDGLKTDSGEGFFEIGERSLILS